VTSGHVHAAEDELHVQVDDEVASICRYLSRVLLDVDGRRPGG
jgi:hypothetical protein